MFKTPYETTTLSNYQLASTRAAVVIFLDEPK
jgi:hypothetical protein